MSNTIEFPKLGLEFDLNPVAFSIGDFHVYWYGIIIAAGMLLAVLYVMKSCKRFAVNSDRLIDVILVGVIAGIIGARLYYVLFNMKEFTSVWSIFDLKAGGLGIYGGLIFGLGAGALMAMWRKVNIPSAFDLASLGFLIGQGIGRWGNFVNQEAFGVNTDLPWGMTGDRVSAWLYSNSSSLAEQGIFVDYSQPVHPTFLYESLWCLAGFLLLHFLSKRRKYNGEIFLLYSAWYGLGRFFIEGLRTDSLYIPGTYIRVSQVVAALAFIGALTAHFLILRRIKQRQPVEPDYVPVFGHVDELSAESLRLHAAELNAQAKELMEQAEHYRILAQEDGEGEDAEAGPSGYEPGEDAAPSSEDTEEEAETGSAKASEGEKEEEEPEDEEESYLHQAEKARRQAKALEEEADACLRKAEALEAEAEKEADLTALKAKIHSLHTRIGTLEEEIAALGDSQEEAEKKQALEEERAQCEISAAECEQLLQEQEAQAERDTVPQAEEPADSDDAEKPQAERNS